MAYKKETIKKVAEKLTEKINYFTELINNNGIEKDTVISNGNRKIGRVLNVSLAPIITCMNCGHCSGYCYDIKACMQYENVLNARAYNTALLKTRREKYFSDIRSKCKRRRKNKYFRWHVSGDIPDYEYLLEMIRIAREFPDFVFWTYTKIYWLVNRYCREYGKESIPNNLHIMFSKWDGLPMDNPYNFPVFACRLKDGNVDTSDDWFAKVYKCPGNCDLCKDKKLGCIGGMNTYADEH
jgi:hypothetical protein